jgi:hypothetical protein
VGPNSAVFSGIPVARKLRTFNLPALGLPWLPSEATSTF